MSSPVPLRHRVRWAVSGMVPRWCPTLGVTHPSDEAALAGHHADGATAKPAPTAVWSPLHDTEEEEGGTAVVEGCGAEGTEAEKGEQGKGGDDDDDHSDGGEHQKDGAFDTVVAGALSREREDVSSRFSCPE